MKRLIVVIPFLFTLPVAASDLDVYESIDEIAIGRVFLTPAQRAALDRGRNLPAARGGEEREEASPAPRSVERPAGYIENSSGERRNWQRGDFVVNDDSSVARFPGDIQIRRHTPEPRDDTDEESSSD